MEEDEILALQRPPHLLDFGPLTPSELVNHLECMPRQFAEIVACRFRRMLRSLRIAWMWFCFEVFPLQLYFDTLVHAIAEYPEPEDTRHYSLYLTRLVCSSKRTSLFALVLRPNMEAKDEEIFTVLADGETARDPARDKPGPMEPGPMEQEENQAERILYSTAQVLPPQSDPRLDWAQVGPFLLSPHGGLPWLLLVMFLNYNLWQWVRYLRMAEKPKATTGGPPTTAEVGAGMMPPPGSGGKTAPTKATPASSETKTGEGAGKLDDATGADGLPPLIPVPGPPQVPPAPPTATMPQAPLTSPPAKAPETKNDTGNLGEYKRALQDVRLWVDDAAHAAASRGKDHLAEVVKETKRVLDEKMLTLADVEKAMREAFAPLRDKLLPTLAGLKNTLGPLPEAGGAGRTIRDVLLATKEHAAKGHKAVEDAAWDSNGRLNTLGTQVANMQTDLCNRIMNTQRKVDNLGQNVQSWGSAPTGATEGDITKILCQLREYQDEIKYQTTQVDALATRVLGLEGSLENVASKLALCQLREYQDEIKYQTTQVDALATRVLGLEGSLENVASKLAAVEGTLSKMAAARPKAPPPSMPAPCLPADVGPGPAPSVPPGQWGPSPDRSADAGPPTTSLRLPPNVQDGEMGAEVTQAMSPVTESALPEAQSPLVKVIPRLMNTALQDKMPHVQLAASRVLEALNGRICAAEYAAQLADALQSEHVAARWGAMRALRVGAQML
eukprot:s6076_g3.t1